MSQWVYQQPPAPSLNGGWFTGTPYMENAPWRSFPVTPDVAFLIHSNLQSANPPPGATTQYPGSYRPGNNAQSMPGVTLYRPGTNDMLCVDSTTTASDLLPKPMPRFAKYAYIADMAHRM